jgi:uncharacterized membrane protein YfcA
MSLFSPGKIALLLAIGAAAGTFSGLVGIGGGVVIVPALVLLLGLDPHRAQGTTLAMLLPPVGLLAAWAYWKQGYVDVPMAALLCLGFLAGGWAGAGLAVGLPSVWLERVFALLLIGLGARMLWRH